MPPSPVEDDLALFNEVQNIEAESFLLQSKVNFDDILPKELIFVSSIGERSDLLDAEGDKNDYDWLISPPETPLFRSLDDEAQPRIPISSQSPPKKGLSPSPRRITSPGSAGASRSRGPSPIKIGRGNSSSPQKIKARKSNGRKRSFDLVRQMDRKGPQHMFRPLLSGVPSSTFHAGEASLQHYSSASSGSQSFVDDRVFVTTVAHNEDTENRSRHGDIDNPSKQGTVDKVMDIRAICSECGQIFSSEKVVIKGDPQYCYECKDSNTNPVGILNSVKEHDDENGSYTVSSTSCDDVSYVSNTSTSVLYSVDLGVPIRQTEGRVYQQSVVSESIEAGSTCTDIESINVFSKTREEEETLHARSDMSMNEEEQEVGPKSSCADMVDIAEVLSTVTLDAMSEIVIENADVISADSHSDVDSTESKRCMDEIHCVEEAITKSVGESDATQPEESRVLLDDRGENEETESRSLTLEEATDAILFCSSIVHILAYEAANTAINNETLSMDVLRPTSTFWGKPDSERKESTRNRRSNFKTQKPQEKTPVMDTKPLPCNADETDENPESPCVVRVPYNVDSSKAAPKLKSKCNCTIM